MAISLNEAHSSAVGCLVYVCVGKEWRLSKYLLQK